jgi:hypothetical protein
MFTVFPCPCQGPNRASRNRTPNGPHKFKRTDFTSTFVSNCPRVRHSGNHFGMASSAASHFRLDTLHPPGFCLGGQQDSRYAIRSEGESKRSLLISYRVLLCMLEKGIIASVVCFKLRLLVTLDKKSPNEPCKQDCGAYKPVHRF